MRQHPASTLFPYTTLFRSPSTSLGARSAAPVAGAQAGDPLLGRRVGAPEVGEVHAPPRQRVDDERAGVGRSEEHTSELQSRENLVCRLLLEKKKRKSKFT